MNEHISTLHPHPHRQKGSGLSPHVGTPPAPVSPAPFPRASLLVAKHPPKPFMAVYRASASWLGSKPGKS